MKLSVFAKKRGISYQTAWRWFKTGKFPSGITMEQMPTGTIIVTEAPSSSEVPFPGMAVYLYARVSTPDRKSDLDAQLGRLAAYAAVHGWAVVESVAEIGSGLSGNRPKLMKLLSNPEVKAILIERRDSLLRFGSEYVEAVMGIQGRKLIVMNPSEASGDMAQDMVDVFRSFCAQRYGCRPAKNRARKAPVDLSRKSGS
jgi:predicted site-specific integrase-resolvase